MADRRELRFGQEDVAAFAAASGDVNPLHVDPVFARRTPFGECVVHGALLALRMIGSLPPEVVARTRSLDVSFFAPLTVGARASLAVAGSDDVAEVELVSRGKRVAQARVRSEAATVEGSPAVAGEPAPARTRPLDRGQELPAAGETVAVRFSPRPELAAVADRHGAGGLDRRLLHGVAAASYVVGMELPGLHSLLGGFALSAAGAGEDAAVAHVRRVDERTGRVVLDLRACGTFGTVECFAREAPHTVDVERLRPARPSPLRAAAVVVVGASRGLGSALALAFLLRGYDVHAVYSASDAAMDDVAAAAGPDAQRLVRHRVDAREAASLETLAERVRAHDAPLRGIVLAAAPPPFGMQLDAGAAADLVEYVAGSIGLAAAPLGALLPLVDDGWAVVCSSVAVEVPPRDWPQYAAAKGALEGLARWVGATRPRLATIVLRLPKLRTEMTATPLARLGAADVEPVAVRVAELVETARPGLTVVEPEQLRAPEPVRT